MASADRFERYEEKRKQTNPPGFLRRAANFISGAALFGVGAAAVIGGGRAAYKAIGEERFLSGVSQAMNAATRGTDLISGVSSGFFRTARSAGWKNVITGKASSELAENLGQSLRPFVAGQMNKGLGGGSVFRTENLLNALRQRYKEAPRLAADDIRAEIIRKKVRATEGITDSMVEDLEKFLNPDSKAFKLKWKDPVEIKNKKFEELILDRIKDVSRGYTGNEKNIIDTALLNLREGLVETSNYSDFTKKYAKEIGAQTKAARDKFIETTIEAAKKTYSGKDVPFAEQLAKKKDPYLRRATYGDLKDADLLRKRQMDKGTGASFYQKIIEEIPELKEKIDDLVIDPSLFIGRQGQFIDTRGIVRTADRAADILGREFQIPFVGIRPFGLIRPLIPNDKNEFMQYVFEAGQKSNIGSSFAATKKRTVFFGGKLFDTAGNIIDENVYLTRFGSHKRSLMQMDEASRNKELFQQLKDDKSFKATVRKLYDLGLQENRGIVGDFESWFTKFGDTLWGPNIVKGIQSQNEFFKLDVYLDAVRSKTKRISDIASRPLGRKELNSAKEAIVKAFGEDFFTVITSGSTQDSVINGMRFAVQDAKISKLLGEQKIKSFESIIARIDKDPDLFYRIKSATSDNIESVWDNLFNSFNISGSNPIKYGDLFSKELHSSIYEQIVPTTGQFKNINEAIRATFKGLEENNYRELLDLDLFNRFYNYKPKDTMALGEMRALIGGFGDKAEWQEPLTKRIQTLYKKADPSWGFGPKPRPADIIGSETPVIIRQSKIGNTFLEGINDSIKNGTFDVKDFFGNLKRTGKQIFKESGFGPERAGRGRLNEATEFTTGIYNTFSRLNQGLEAASVGLSKQYTGSSQDLATNLFLRRVLLPVVTIGYLSYLNDQIGNFTGEEPSDIAVKGFASASLGVQKAKDIVGINSFSQRWEQILPGSKHLWESPVLTPIRIASFGALGDNRGYDELYHYLTEGDQAIRKGRWWTFGSNTPWYGGRISGHRPSYYRRMLGEPTMTDSLWGSESEYWSNNWLPTPHNPLGPIKTWILDPYHWERRNAANRPTAAYGGIPELESIPIVGPLTDATIGRIFKPIRRNPELGKAHRKYLTEINEGIKKSFETQASGGLVYITPGGRMTPKEMGESFGYGLGFSEDGTQISEGTYPSLGRGTGDLLETTYGSPGRGARSSRDQLTNINTNIKNIPNLDTRSIRSLEDSRLSDSLTDFADPSSVMYRMNESFYNVREIMGLRGFAIEALFGDVGKPSMMLESSTRSYGYERRFWDQEMGGRTGDLSEIVRRFIPHRRRDIIEYNPIRNQMPDWMPSNKDYFMDFLHGDPYLKVTMGEARLPGEGYESVNKLHPDKYFGRYGAIDRMKILGDVAPWSPQYSYYSRVVTQMYQSGLYTDKEYDLARRTREQVSQRKKKYEFFNYKFKDSGLTEKMVTVSRMIDPYTFMTEEFGAVPIKLAGVKGPKSRTTEEGQVVSNISSNMLQAGSRVKIAYSDDPLKTVRGDVMNSINAVVWSNGKKVQGELIKSGFVKADYESTDPAAVNALYSGFERTAGKLWESISHMDTPIHTKFLQVRSPIEMYERNIVYGKEFQSWESPIKSWVVPTLNKAAARNPALSLAGGAFIGSFFGRSPEAKVVAAVLGGTAAFLPSATRTIKEFSGKIYDDQYTWIPKEERKVRDIEEYFDKLKYVKYKGLYEKAKRSAKLYEGVDVDELLESIEDESGLNSGEARKLKRIKATIKSTMGDSIVDSQEAQERINAINERLAEISGKKRGVLLGPIAMQALQYKQEYESTLYGADPYGDLLNIYQALPKRERPFFQEFLKAKPKEREKILRLVPKNQRRFYQAKWGLAIDRKQSLTEYFANHYLPGVDWKGWMPEQSLEETKLKFVENKSLDLSDFGFWQSDLSEIGYGTPAINRTKSSIVGLDLIKLKAVLEGRGLSDVDIFISKEQSRDPNTSFEMNLDIKHNRKKEVSALFNQNITSLLG